MQNFIQGWKFGDMIGETAGIQTADHSISYS